MPSLPATRRASAASCGEQQPRESEAGSPARPRQRKTPVTSCPASRSSAAATEESTPPLIATRTRCLRDAIGRGNVANTGRIPSPPIRPTRAPTTETPFSPNLLGELCSRRMAATDSPSAAVSPPPRFARELDTLIRARYPLVYLVTWEEQRLDAHLDQLARQHGKALWSWTVTRGLRRAGGARTGTPESEGASEPRAALDAIGRLSDPSLVVLKVFHPYLSDPTVIRALRDLAHALKSTYTTVILLSPSLVIPAELEKEISVLDVPLPPFQELFELLKEIATVVRKGNLAKVELTQADAEAMVKAAQGLTLAEAENAFAKAIADDGRLKREDVALVLEEKRQVIRKSGLLEYFAAEQKLADVGGLELLKGWLDRRAAAFGEAARRFGLPEPKGLLLLGVQGCGKSLTAKAIAAQWKLPLLRLDMGRIFSGLVGSSEENLRRAIQMAEGVAPVVLWVDEIEKGLAGVRSSDASDSGVTARVFGTLLTWLQEKTAPAFVVAIM